MFVRHIKPLVEKALARSPVVLLNGARQVGKSTLALEFADRGYSYFTFDDEITYLSAKANMTGFIASLPKPVILDEVQRIPEIFLPIKMDVDNNRNAGRYFLTGSANPLLVPRMGDSLVDRMEIINLMPLSQGEILNKQDYFIDYVMLREPIQAKQHSQDKQMLYTHIMTGGYPLVQQMNVDDRDAWFRSYINLLLQRDIRDLAQVEKLTEFPNLLKLLAARASGLLNVADLSRESNIPVKTLHRYLALLHTIYIVSFQSPWHTNLVLRFTKSPKVYFTDTGLLSYLVGMNLERAVSETIQMGKILENFVVAELSKQATWAKTQVQLHHFRSTDGKEVDIIMEDRAGNMVGIEIKHSQAVTLADAKNLLFLQEKIGKRFVKGIILYMGSQTMPLADNIYVMPVSSLWNYT